MEATELTWADQLILQGREQALREAILRAIRLRFRSVPPSAEQAVQTLAREEDLLAFFDRVLTAQSLSDLPKGATSQ